MIQQVLDTVVKSLNDLKGKDIITLNTSTKSDLFDYIVIVTGKTTVHTRAIAKNLIRDVKKAGFKKHKLEGEDYGHWIITDINGVLVHIMLEDVREYYCLEQLWGS